MTSNEQLDRAAADAQQSLQANYARARFLDRKANMRKVPLLAVVLVAWAGLLAYQWPHILNPAAGHDLASEAEASAQMNHVVERLAGWELQNGVYPERLEQVLEPDELLPPELGSIGYRRLASGFEVKLVDSSGKTIASTTTGATLGTGATRGNAP